MVALLVSKDSMPKIPTRQKTSGTAEDDFNDSNGSINSSSITSCCHRIFDDLDTIPICPTRHCSIEQEEEETKTSQWIPKSPTTVVVHETRDTSPIKPTRKFSSTSEISRSSRLSPPTADENTLMPSSTRCNRRRKISATSSSSSQLTSTSTHCKRSRRQRHQQQQSATNGPIRRRNSLLLRNFPSFYSETLDTIDEIECDNDN